MKYFLSLVFFITSLFGYCLEFSGFSDILVSSLIEKNYKIATSYQRFRGEINQGFNDVSLFTSINGKLDNISETTDISINELYLDYYNHFFEARFGKQLVIWGNADGVRITDIICPSNLNEIMAQEFDDIREPINLLKIKSNLNFANLELIWIPIYQGDKLPEETNPYFDNLQIPDSLLTNKPSQKLKNSEFAGKISFYNSYFDFIISYSNTWNDSPIYKKTDDNKIIPTYFRTNIIGIELSKPVKSFIIRSELAIYLDNHFPGKKEISKHKTKSMIGLDYYFNNNLTFNFQFLYDKIWDYEKIIQEKETQSLITFNVNYTLFRETLKFQNMIYYNIEEENTINKFSIDYSINDNLHILTGLDLFSYEKNSIFYKKSQLWFKTKINF